MEDGDGSDGVFGSKEKVGSDESGKDAEVDDHICPDDDWPAETKSYRIKVEGLESDLKALGDETDNDDGETGDADDTVRDDEPRTPAIGIFRAMTTVFDAQAEAAANALRGGAGKAWTRRKARREDITPVKTALESEQFLDQLSDGLQTPITQAMNAGADAGLDRIGVSAGFDVTDPQVAESLRRRTLKLAGDINRVTVDRISRVVADGLDSGKTTREIANTIRQDFDEIGKVRAERIARTESANAYVDGEVEGWKQSGAVAKQKWLLAPNACPVCRAIAAKFPNGIEVGGTFVDQGGSVPLSGGRPFVSGYKAIKGPAAHPGCRCDLLPVLGDS